MVLTKVHAGGKFDHDTYKVSGGLHGVGVTVVNALSEWLEAEIHRDGKVWKQDYRQGVAQGPVRETGPAKKTGTKITFLPDDEIFPVIDFDHDVLEKRLRELAFLNQGITIRLTDERGDEVRDQEFYSSGGLGEFVAYLNRAQTAIHPPVVLSGKDEERAVEVEVALQYNESISEMVVSYCNNINTVEGGTHLTGFRTALTRTLNSYAKARRAGQEQGPDDHRRGLQGGPDGDRQRARARPAVRGADQDEAGQRRGRGDRRQGRQRQARRVPREEPGGGQEGDRQGAAGGRGARGGAEGPRAGPQPQGGALRRRPARQADGLHHPRPGLQRAVPRRGRQRRRHRRRGPRPELPGDPPAPRQDPQRRARPARPGARQRGGPQHHHGRRQRDRRGGGPRQAAVRQGRDDERRRRRRVAHPDPADDLLLPPDAPARGRGAPVRRPAAAVHAQPQEGAAVRPDRHRDAGDPGRARAGERPAPAGRRRRRDRRASAATGSGPCTTSSPASTTRSGPSAAGTCRSAPSSPAPTPAATPKLDGMLPLYLVKDGPHEHWLYTAEELESYRQAHAPAPRRRGRRTTATRASPGPAAPRPRPPPAWPTSPSCTRSVR